MAVHALWDNFAAFFGRLNPSPTFVSQAVSQHTTITSLIGSPSSSASVLSPQCFLQGSYKQETAIYAINDVDIVVLSALWQPGEGSSTGRTWSRDEIFDTIAAPLRADWRYAGKVHYKATSMCIKVDLGIKVEILPVVFKGGNYIADQEPFRLFRPETGIWEDGYARQHQNWLSWKNNALYANGNYIRAIKIVKHLRSYWNVRAVSFHIECLLFILPDALFAGGPADYVPALLTYVASIPASSWYQLDVMTPCGERRLFSESEWNWACWSTFHQFITSLIPLTNRANSTPYRDIAIEAWQAVLGDTYFPKEVSR